MSVINGIDELPLMQGYHAKGHMVFQAQNVSAGTAVQWISQVIPRLRGGVALYGVMRANNNSTGTLGTVGILYELENGWGYTTLSASNQQDGLSFNSSECVGVPLNAGPKTFTLRPAWDAFNVDSRVPYFHFDNCRLVVGIPAGQTGSVLLDCNVYAVRAHYPTTGNYPTGLQGSISAS